MRISIITPTFNAYDTLQRTMDSVAAQTVNADEYLVIDGASHDKTLQLAQEHGAATVIDSKPDHGIADAFNRGIELSTGDVIGIINADDWYEPDTISLVKQTFILNPDIDVVYGTMRYWNSDGDSELYFPNKNKLNKEMTLNHPAVFIRRKAYDLWGKYRMHYKYAMDYELLLRFFVVKAKFMQIDAVLTNMSHGGVSDENWHKAYVEVAKIKILHLRSPVSAWAYCAFQILRTTVRRLLTFLGAEKVVRYWRKNHSIVRKN